MARKLLPADATEAQILEVIASSTMALDEISFLTGIPVEMVSATLAMMELKGLVRNSGTMTFSAIHEAIEDYQAGDYEK